MDPAFPVVLSLGLLFFAGVVGHHARIEYIQRKREYVTGGHLAKPVRRLRPGYGYNDAGNYVWNWQCKYCGEEHDETDQFSGECEL